MTRNYAGLHASHQLNPALFLKLVAEAEASVVVTYAEETMRHLQPQINIHQTTCHVILYVLDADCGR